MVVRSYENSTAAWAFLIGIILAIAIGIAASSFLSLPAIKTYSAPIYGILVLLGLIVGFSTKVSSKDSETFLIAGAVLVIVSKFGMESVSSSLIGIGVGDLVSSTFAALLALLVPATIVVAIKRVFFAANI
ncbi:MAG: hypothetical protein AABW63_03715 [Nanoarchaeota archaeon]